MRAIFEIDFKDGKEAENAKKVIKAEKGKNSVLHVLHKEGGFLVQQTQHCQGSCKHLY